MSPGVAALLWAGLGAALVLIAGGLRRQWRGHGLRPWVILLGIALVAGGVMLSWSMEAWLGEAGLVYAGGDGQRPAPVPASVIGSWPLVRSSAHVAVALGLLALFLVLNTSAVRRGRASRG